MVRTDKTLDIKGVPGPRTVMITEHTLNGMRRGQVLKVIRSDAAARHDLAALCERIGCTILRARNEDGLQILIIEKTAA